MKTPELSVLWSPSIDQDLLFGARELATNSGDLSLLADRLELKMPDALTVALLRPEEQRLQLEPHFSGRSQSEDAGHAPDMDNALPVYIGELSEQNILRGLAHSLVARAQAERHTRVLIGAGTALFAEVGIGATIQQAGSFWGLVSLPMAGATLGGVWLWQRSQRGVRPEVPSLDGLRSPIRIMPVGG